MNIKQFFEDEYIQFANNDNYQNLASYIDGFRPTARKVFYTFRNKVKGKIKVAQLASKTAEETEYLGGENNINGVIINISKNFVGSNNIPIFTPHGHFGSRFYPDSASAPRYIFVSDNSVISEIFNPEDDKILIQQEFEGKKIEPAFFVPNLPMILVNGSEGIGTGFSQKILPRDPKNLKKTIKNILEGKNPRFIKPHFNNFKGTIERAGDKWKIEGVISLKETKRGYDYYEITELPIGVKLPTFLKKLDSLVEKGIIVDFTDKSDDDNFYFIVKAKTGKDIEYWKTTLGIVTTVTENFSTMGEDYRVRVFEDEIDLLKAYIKIKIEYTQKRKNLILENLKSDIEFLIDRIKFIKSVVTGSLIINKRKKDQIISDAKKLGVKKPEEHLKIPLYSLTEEDIRNLKEKIEKKKNEYLTLKEKSPEEIWLEEI